MALELLDPDDPGMTRVSPKLAVVRRLTATFWYFPVLLALVALTLFLHPAWLIVLVPVIALFVWNLWLIGRQVSAHRYVEGPDDMIVARGRWWRSVTVVPYGRIQFIDINEGPMLRMFGLASIKLNTASATSDAQLSGLPRAEARALRERLSARARERMAGL
ncbi:PH domain-containing protein [uncultured Corynebacterium sp.]|uniref:PH domain-containing protein n=1 Tax=uncultured Corynebacterium sp. TaxID=159447 RepID=UPI0025DB73C4|nr:PH domain-containing protein [uncultured Corynebacterium sp.]